MPDNGLVALTGSACPLPDGAAFGPPAPSGERIDVTMCLRDNPRAPRVQQVAASLAMQPPGAGRHLSREEFAARLGAAPRDMDAAVDHARRCRLDVLEASSARRTLRIRGTAAAMSEAFGVTLRTYRHAGRRCHGYAGEIRLPRHLSGIVTGVFGLDTRPVGTAQVRVAGQALLLPHYTPPQVAHMYGLQAGASAAGQTVALLELGGGFREGDAVTYFRSLGLPVPRLFDVSVDSGQNAPAGHPGGADGEVMLDIDIAGSCAPGADLVVYFAPNTEQGFVDGILAAAHDTVHRPTVLSISWGAPESAWTAQGRQHVEAALQAAGAMGMSVFCAAGDRGSTDGVGDGRQHVDFPASAPSATGCGGTRLVGDGRRVVRETVWCAGRGGATGGGVSDHFALPAYQREADVCPSANPGRRRGRGVPDVAGNADPATGYRVRVDGVDYVLGGTSAVAPLWAALVASLNTAAGRSRDEGAGFLNPLLYGAGTQSRVTRPVVAGRNGAYSAGPGWNACTGLGSPDAARLLAALGRRLSRPASPRLDQERRFGDGAELVA